MRKLTLALLAGSALMASASVASAADLLLDPPMQEPTAVDNSFNFEGLYMGSFIAGQSVPSAFGLGVNLGVNALSDAILFGGELELTALSNSTWSAQATGKIGALVTENVALYAFSGIGTHSTNDGYVPLGAGLEFGISDGLSLKTEYQHNFDLSNSAQDADVVKIGLNWHF
jgi:opacity protein-like surface antigen